MILNRQIKTNFRSTRKNIFFLFFLLLFQSLNPVALAEEVTIGDVSDPRPRVYSRGHEMLTEDLNQIIPFLEPGWNLDAFVAGGDIDYIGPGVINGNSSTFLRAYTNSNLKNTPLFALPGNHEVDNIYDLDGLNALYDTYQNWNLKPGPAACPKTTYSFDKGNLHVSILNVYCDEGGPKVTSGDIPDYLFDWLKNDLRNSDKKYKIVFGHEPAYPNGRHVGDSLDVYPEKRDRFWNLLVTEKVFAYMAGHVHISRMANFDGVWEMNTGVSGSSRNSGFGSNPFTTLNYIHTSDDGILIKQVRESRTGPGIGPSAWPAATSETKTRDDAEKDVLVNTFERAGTRGKYWVDYDSSVEENPDWSSNNNGKWWEKNFDDSGWSSGEAGMGYDIFNLSKWGWINTVLNPDPGSSGSNHIKAVFQRMPFSVYKKELFPRLKLGVDHNGGITAWLNGTKVYESPQAPSFDGDNYSNNFDKSPTGDRTIWGKELEAPSMQDIDISQYKDLLNNGDDNVLVIAHWNPATAGYSASGVRLSLQPEAGPYKYWVSYNDGADIAKTSYASDGNVTNLGGEEKGGELKAYFDGSTTGVDMYYTTNRPTEKAGAEDSGTGGRTPPVYPRTTTDAYNEFGTKINMAGANTTGVGVSTVVTFDNLSSEKKYQLVALGMRGRFSNKWCRYTLSDTSSFTNSSSSGTSISSIYSNNDSTTYACGDNYQNGYVAKWTDIIPGSSSIKLTYRGVGFGSDASAESFLSAIKLVEQKPGNPTISSASNKYFALTNDSNSVSAADITITDDSAVSTIKADRDLRIRIPSTLSMKWDASGSGISISGSAAGKVSSSFSYEQDDRYLVIPVNEDFAAGESITISGLKFTMLTASGSEKNLELIIDGADGYPIAYDDKGISLGRPTVSSAASKVFAIAGSSKPAPDITITEDASSQIIKADKDIYLHIPDGLNLKWDESHADMEITGNASSRISSSTAVFQDDDKTIFIDVGEDFMPRETITIKGLYLTDSSAPGATGSIELKVDGLGNVSSTDDKSYTVAPMPIVSITESSSHPSNTPAGSDNVVMGVAAVVSTSAGTGVKSTTIEESGTINAGTNLKDTELWLSNDPNWDSGDNQLESTKDFSDLDGELTFTEDFTLGTETKYLIIRSSVAAETRAGKKIKFSFKEAAVDVDCNTANFPMDISGQTNIDPIPVTWLTTADWDAGQKDETVFVNDSKVGVGYFDDFDTALENNKWSDENQKWTKEGVSTGIVKVTDFNGSSGTGYLTVTSPSSTDVPAPADIDTTHAVFVLPPGKTLSSKYTLWYNGVTIKENSDAATSFSKGRFASYMYAGATNFFSVIGSTHWGSYRLGRTNGSYANTYFSGSAVTSIGVASPAVIPGSPINVKITVNGTSASTHTHTVYASSGTPTSATIAHTDTTNITGARTFAFSAAYPYLQRAYQNFMDSIWLRGGFSGGSYTSGWKDTGEVMSSWGKVTIGASITGDQSVTMIVRSSVDGNTVAGQTETITLTNGENDYDISSLAAGRYLSLNFTFSTGTTNDTPTVNSASWSKVVSYPDNVPDPPSDFSAEINDSSNRIDLSWTRSSDNEDVFYVERREDFGNGFGSWEKISTLDGEEESFSDQNNIQSNQRYQYRVRSSNGVGLSQYTESSIVSSPPSAPSDLISSSVKKDSIRWSWNDNSFFEDGFKIRFTEGNISDIISTGNNTNSYENQNLEPNTGYKIGLKSYQGSNESSETFSETVYTLASDPSNFQVSTENGKMFLSVDALPNDNKGQSGYYFYNDTDEIGSGWIQTNRWEIPSPKNNTIYEYQVIQRNYNGIEAGLECYETARCYPKEGAYIKKSTFAPTPKNLGGNLGINTIKISVDAFANDTLNQSGYYFENQTKGTNSGWIQTNEWTESNLEENTSYVYTIKQRNCEGVETEQTSATKTTLAASPSEIKNEVSKNSVKISAKNFANSQEKKSGYRFENETLGTNSGWIQKPFWEESGLECNKKYHYRIKNRNQNGIESAYTFEEVQTSACDKQTSGNGGGQPDDSTITLGNLKSKNLSSEEAISVIGNRIFFRGRKTDNEINNKPSEIIILIDGKVSKKIKVKNLALWRTSLLEKPEWKNLVHSYRILYFDLEKNLVDKSSLFSVLIDKKKPTIKAPRSFLKASGGNPIKIVATDNGDIAAYSLTLRGKKFPKQASPEFRLPENLPKGRSKMKIFVFDEAGNICSRNTWVINE